MKKIIFIFLAGMLLFACDTYEERERERSAERIEEGAEEDTTNAQEEVEVETE